MRLTGISHVNLYITYELRVIYLKADEHEIVFIFHEKTIDEPFCILSVK